ncbi:hypothetical protein AAFN88_07205 [Pelagibius sp. CAU 1746]|uniref:hypothetical protein n=1 Tax=Pelagibius sp. CAU 1746 TaxID=3140370 RepID=UPI00325B2817
MPPCDLYKQFEYISNIDHIAGRHGMKIEVSADFEAFRQLRGAQQKRLPISPIFDCQETELNGANGFWIKGTSSDGELVHLQAVRLEDMSGLCLAEHLYQHRHVYAPPGVEVDLERTDYAATPASHRITGKVCYHGELWLKGGPGGYRGHGLTAALPRLALALAHMAWSPDYMFGLVHPLAACKGLPAREGYMHLEPGGILWHRKDSDEVYDEWLVWMGHGDLQHLLRFPPLALYEQLEAKSKDSAGFANRVRAAA